MSDSGTTIVFDVFDNVNPEQAWAVTPSGPTLVSATAGGGPGNNDSWVQDVTPDGRYVLFSSIATDLQGGVGDPAGRLYIRDLQAGTTTLLPLLVVDGQQPSLSADGQRVANRAPATLPSSGGAVLTQVAAVFDRTTGKVTKLLPTGTAADADWLGLIEISDNGRRGDVEPRRSERARAGARAGRLHRRLTPGAIRRRRRPRGSRWEQQGSVDGA